VHGGVSGSAREVQDVADQILALLVVRIRSGELLVRDEQPNRQWCRGISTRHNPYLAGGA